MPTDPSGKYFDVDRSGEPESFVRYLDVASQRADIQGIKQQSYALLGAHAGQQLLDVGCGTGEDVRALAQLTGPTGQVVGVDTSMTMIEEATRRSAGFPFPVAFRQGDGAALPFADASFDGCRAERVLQHVADPEQALRELVRVARSQARIVVVDADHGMLALDASNREVTRRIYNTRCDNAITNGWIGRQLPRLMRQAGVEEISIQPAVVLYTALDEAAFDVEHDLRQSVDRALERSVVSADEARAFWEEVQTRARDGQFFIAGVIFSVAGRKA